ncbi:transcriptional regulator (plasmid) [Vibrio tubiashii]|uniref:transcriptional regulator n=1 Tax=Vibrio tubiashii TaxID=29498 RepID=UPI00234F57FF|nr:transcriptional regulator [Vibrio tubiashii]WCP70334.1 transcriptional regulator [Vibrio tubiashii]
MSVCVALTHGLLAKSTDGTCDYLLLTKVEAAQLVENGQATLSFFQFDPAMYEFFLGQLLLTFIGGHIMGRVIKYLGKK